MGRKNKQKNTAVSTLPENKVDVEVVKKEPEVEQKAPIENESKNTTQIASTPKPEEKVENISDKNEINVVADKENVPQAASKSKRKRHRKRKNAAATKVSSEIEESSSTEPPPDTKKDVAVKSKEKTVEEKVVVPTEPPKSELPQACSDNKNVTENRSPVNAAKTRENRKKNKKSSNNDETEKVSNEKDVKELPAEKVEVLPAAHNNETRKSKNRRRGDSKKCIPDELQERLEREQREARDQLKNEIEKREKLLEKIEMVLDCKKQEKKIAKDHQDSIKEMVALTSLASSSTIPANEPEKDLLVDKIEQVLGVTKLEIKNVQNQQAFVGRLETELSKIKDAKNNYLQGETSDAAQASTYKLPEHIEKLKKGIKNVEEVKSKNKDELLKEIESRDILMAEINKVLNTTKTEIQNVQKQQKIIANLETELHKIKEAEINEKLLVLNEEMNDEEEEEEKVNLPVTKMSSSSLLDTLMANVGKIKDIHAQKQQQKELAKTEKNIKKNENETKDNVVETTKTSNDSTPPCSVVKAVEDIKVNVTKTETSHELLQQQPQKLSMADMLRNAPTPPPEEEKKNEKKTKSSNNIKKNVETAPVVPTEEVHQEKIEAASVGNAGENDVDESKPSVKASEVAIESETMADASNISKTFQDSKKKKDVKSKNSKESVVEKSNIKPLPRNDKNEVSNAPNVKNAQKTKQKGNSESESAITDDASQAVVNPPKKESPSETKPTNLPEKVIVEEKLIVSTSTAALNTETSNPTKKIETAKAKPTTNSDMKKPSSPTKKIETAKAPPNADSDLKKPSSPKKVVESVKAASTADSDTKKPSSHAKIIETAKAPPTADSGLKKPSTPTKDVESVKAASTADSDTKKPSSPTKIIETAKAPVTADLDTKKPSNPPKIAETVKAASTADSDIKEPANPPKIAETVKAASTAGSAETKKPNPPKKTETNKTASKGSAKKAKK
ncbi:CLUMA_CG018155, isoform A [Clunio marinus]|uniref:CLUMA_CG018155, isoform A n=1 Tax=Clunio marinus TaxID=568069 RepID=A0A1J1IXR8_9DIPT|nr:CLUMA_CG018155, isoform A [Clunio marinus]